MNRPGLDAAAVRAKQAQFGANILAEHRATGWSIFIRQFKSSFVYLLLAAAALAYVLGEYIDGTMIVLFVLVNAVLGFWQEFKSEKTSQMLKQLTMTHARVRRAGKDTAVPSSEVVPGDILLLEAGDIICADAKLLEVNDLQVNESVLTGESVPITKTVDQIVCSATNVLTGHAEAEVIAIGHTTEMGKVAKLTTETVRVSSFEQEINRFSSFILRLVLLTLTVVLITHLLFKQDPNFVDLIIFAIALAVGVIPEALPVVTTFSLSRGAQRLAKQKVVVKRLTAIEDLGGVEVLCTDKTGTITQNKLTVSEIRADDQAKALWFAAAAGDFTVQDPFDVALLNALPEAQQAEAKQLKAVNEIPFDPERKRNSVLVDYNGKRWLIVRGAPEVVMKCCDHLHQTECQALLDWIDEQGQQGRRALGVAVKEFSGDHYEGKDELDGATYLGAIAFADPVKPSTAQAIHDAKALGVQVKILTGDSAAVAGSVAQQIGLIPSSEHVITGQELLGMSDVDQMDAVAKYHVFARVAPAEKFNIIQLLKKSSKQIGFLGEGINDAPALKASNVGLVVNNASDIAREAADVILLDQSLEVIIDGIREGRAVFANTMKYIQATLSSNFGNFYAVAIVSLFIDFLPMLPLQILLVNLLSDFPMVTIAADRVDPAELQHPKAYHVRDILLLATVLGLVSTAFDFTYFAVFMHGTPSQLQTNWFIGSILTELLFLFSIRNRRFFLRGTGPAPIITVLSLVAATATIIIPFTSLGSSVFQFTAPTMNDVLMILAIAFLYLVTTETVKLLYYKYTRQ